MLNACLRSLRIVAVLTAACLPPLACSDGTGPDGALTVEEFRLDRVGDTAVPVTLGRGDVRLEIRSGTFTLTNDSLIVRRTVIRQFAGPASPTDTILVDVGFIAGRLEGQLNLAINSSRVTTIASRQGDTLLVAYSGTPAWVYVRRR